MRNKAKFPEGEFFHIFNKSIAGYRIFSDSHNPYRFFQTLGYYNTQTVKYNLAKYLKRDPKYSPNLLIYQEEYPLKFISYCIMPDHYHLLMKIVKSNFLSKYISNIENSFTRYFNLRNKRKGPLWQSRFKSVRITTNEQLLHVSRYIHLNPTSSNFVNHPEDWTFSSYKDLIHSEALKNYIHEISINNPVSYKKFVDDNIDYQRKLKEIRRLKLD